jgi:mRNA-degrading endonuclease RelE of RelBE toxin-antitoxin system
MERASTAVDVGNAAQIAIRSLHPTDRVRIERAIDMLKGFPDPELPTGKVRKIAANSDLYIARASSNLRIIFRYDGGSVHIMDVLTKDRLRRMHELSA